MSRRFCTFTEIARELRVRAATLRDLGVLDGCRTVPAGTIGKYEMYLWSDVERAVFEFARSGRSTGKPGVAGQLSLPATSFESLAQ